MDGGARVATVFTNHGVEFMFTLCGGHISPIAVEAKKQGVRIIDVRHEVNAVFAADAVARLTGKPGVAAVTAGPGVTNTITAIKNAQLAQSPLVLIGGATATILRGRGSLQDIDQLALIEPHVKLALRPDTLKEVVPALEQAFRVAQEGVPGPVFVELAVDLLYDESIVREWYGKTVDKPDKTLPEKAQAFYIKRHLDKTFAGPKGPRFADGQDFVPTAPPKGQVKRAAQLLSSAERPVMVIGSQATLRAPEIGDLVEAVEAIGVPVYCSGMSRGLLGKGHPLQLRHKRRLALKGADVVVLVGVPCDFRLDYGSHVSRAKVIGINLSEEDLKKNRRPNLGILADPHTTLVAIAGEMGAARPRDAWWKTLRERDAARNDEIAKMADEEISGINPLALCMELERQLADRSVLVGDGGDFVATAAYTVSPRGPLSWLDPGVFGTLGVGAGFALGAKLVRPDADVWILYGDGAAGFSMLEFDTFARHGVAVNALIGNDAGWTQIQRDQVPILGDDVATVLAYTDYHVIAEGCGGAGLVVRDPTEVKATLEKAVEISRGGKPVCVNAIIGKTDFRKGSISM